MESYPVKRQRLSDDPTQLRRWMRGDRRLHRRQTLVSDGVEVVATTVVVAVDVDENGTPIATSTVINPSPASSAPTLPSATSSSTFIASGSPTLTSILSPTASNLNVIPGPQLSSSFGNTTIRRSRVKIVINFLTICSFNGLQLAPSFQLYDVELDYLVPEIYHFIKFSQLIFNK
ncbi:hypothetical protein EJ06DRAFT_428303 [Trichodelitschia bisporula]|uniref:Uncharacterized protein n=1 Tax=Trichodelitschia bisporula TaxID=703511 RepID=A0A6G1HXB9_9PEZI|nr:hypothetical protein EJ06DRAFT_428303 [Trichodelitschia bisporula]